MIDPLISIIIPTYNRAFIIKETLDSIHIQSYANWECIIVDDASTDDTKIVIEEYSKNDSRFRFYKRPANTVKGANSCRNFGFSQAEGNLVQWFDSDDLLVNNAFELYVKEFEKAPTSDVVIAKVQMVDLNSNVLIKKNTIQSENLVQDYFVGNVAFYVCGPIWKKEFLTQQDKLFCKNVSNLDDWDFNLRMLYADPEIIFIDLPLIKYRVHSNSLSHEIGKLNHNEINSEISAREKHLKLIQENKKADSLVLKKFILFRYKYFFREAMVQKDKHRFFYLNNLIKKELDFFYFRGLIKTLFGFIIFSTFNKGYKLLK